jgi:putative Mg2+ transporter-C (MgtC) family protein
MVSYAAFGEPVGQGWTQVGELAVTFALSALIGLERELKQKSAGLRTYTVVGFGSALFMLVSKYGFTDVLVNQRVVLDPSRVAAQIVSGLGFIGGGIIFVKRDSVRGLTTAASIWLTAAVGAAAGAGLVVLAAVGTAAYFLAVLALPPVARLAARYLHTPAPSLRVRYLDGRGLLRDLLGVVTDCGFLVADLATTHYTKEVLRDEAEALAPGPSVEVSMRLGGRGDLQAVVGALSEIDGVLAVATTDADEPY